MIKSEHIVDAVHTLEKFRNEIIKCVFLVVFATAVVYFQSGYLIEVLSKPLDNLPLFFLTPVEGIMIKMQIAIIGGVVLCIPIIAYRITFLSSAKISKKNRKLIYFLVIPFAIVAFIMGMLFAYTLALPATIKFLLSSGTEFMRPTISGGSYFSFVTVFLVALGAVFELPLVLVAISRIGIVTYKTLSNKRRIAVLSIVVIAAIITPTPDAFSLIIVSLPMIVLYEIGIWWIFILEKSDKKQAM